MITPAKKYQLLGKKQEVPYSPMPADIGLGSLSMGVPIASGAPATTTFNTNAAANWCALSYIAPVSLPLRKVRIRVNSVTGTLGVNDMVCEVWSHSGTQPSAMLSSTNVVTTTPTGAAVVEFTGLNQAQILGTVYHLVFKNVNGTPASNFYQVLLSSSVTVTHTIGSLVNHGMGHFTTTTSGGSWTPTANQLEPMQLEFSDGVTTYQQGLLFSTLGYDSTNSVYSDREVGVMLKTPNVRLNIAGLSFQFRKQGTPTGNVLYKIYSGTTLLSTAAGSLNADTSTTGSWVPAFFPTSIQLAADTDYSFIFAESTQADSSANRFELMHFTIPNDAGILANKPFGGSVKQNYYNGTTWTQDPLKFPLFVLLLDKNTPFSP